MKVDSYDEERTTKVWHCYIARVSLTRCCGPDAPVQGYCCCIRGGAEQCIVAFCMHSAEWFGIAQSAYYALHSGILSKCKMVELQKEG